MVSPILKPVPGRLGRRIFGKSPVLGVADLVKSVVQATVR
jgi:hypothetical protein